MDIDLDDERNSTLLTPLAGDRVQVGGDTYTATIKFREIDGRLRPVQLELEADDGPVTPKMLTSVPLVAAEASLNRRRLYRLKHGLRSGEWEYYLPIIVPDERPYPEDFWQAVASNYMELVAAGLRDPAVRLSEQTGRPIATVHRWIGECRKRHFIPKGNQGRLG